MSDPTELTLDVMAERLGESFRRQFEFDPDQHEVVELASYGLTGMEPNPARDAALADILVRLAPGAAPSEGVPVKFAAAPHTVPNAEGCQHTWQGWACLDGTFDMTCTRCFAKSKSPDTARLASASPARSDRAADGQGDGARVDKLIEQFRLQAREAPTGDRLAQELRAALAAAPTPAPEGVDLRAEDVETAAIALWRLEHPEDDEFSAVAPNDWLRWPETPREASLAYETHSREEYREQARVVFASVGKSVPATDRDSYDKGYQHGKQVGASQEKHGHALRALPLPDPEHLVRQYAKNPSAIEARLDPQADKVDALRVAAPASAIRQAALAAAYDVSSILSDIEEEISWAGMPCVARIRQIYPDATLQEASEASQAVRAWAEREVKATLLPFRTALDAPRDGGA